VAAGCLFARPAIFLHLPDLHPWQCGHVAPAKLGNEWGGVAFFWRKKLEEKFDWLRELMRGTRVDPAHYPRIKGHLLRAFDKTDMADRLDRLRQVEPDIFDMAGSHAEDIRAVLKASGVKSAYHATLKSILRWHSSRESMQATVDLLKRKNAPDWFRRR
jgi:hypothetical protein